MTFGWHPPGPMTMDLARRATGVKSLPPGETEDVQKHFEAALRCLLRPFELACSASPGAVTNARADHREEFMTAARIALTSSLLLYSGWVMAEEAPNTISVEQMGVATGLAEIISSADACGYKVDQDALASYYSTQGLATPRVLSFISGTITMNKKAAKPSPSQCTLIKTTATAARLLAD